MSKHKSFIACIVAACITFFALPVNSYAVAASPSVPTGTVPFFELPQGIQRSFEDSFYEACRYLFSGREKKQIVYTDKDGKEHVITESSLQADWEEFLDCSAVSIESIGNGLYNFAFELATPSYNETAWDNPIFSTVTESVCDDLSKHTESELLNPTKTTIFRDAFDRSNNVFHNLDEALNITDSGKSLFDRFFSLYNISSVEAIPMEPFTLKLTPSAIPVGDSCFSYAVVRHYSNQSPKLEFYSQSCQNPYYNWMGRDIVHSLSVVSDDFNLTMNGSLMLNGKISELATPYIYKFYFPTGQDYKDMAWTGNLAVTDDDLVALPGINFDTKSDLEKAAEMLAQQLGVDINRILDEFKLVYDENGERYLESSKGIRTALEDLVTAYNESVAGNQAIINSLEKLLEQLKAQDISGLESYIASIESTLDDLNSRDKDREAVYGDIVGSLGDIKTQLGNLSLEIPEDITTNIQGIYDLIKEQSISDVNFNKFIDNQLIPIINDPYSMNFPLYNQCKYLLENLFNYNDRLSPPNFDFYMDINKDGINEKYTLIDLSILETTLTNENMVDKSWWATPIKVIDIIRYILAAVVYSLFVVLLLKRLPSFYGSSPWWFLPFLH